MFNFLFPDFYYHSVHEIPFSFFKENGIEAVLFDIDNTLEPYESPKPSDDTKELFNGLKDNGIKFAIVSNNNFDRVSEFCRDSVSDFSYHSKKPSPEKINELLDRMSVEKANAVLIGDQLFTDMWAASNAGVKSILVDRINNNESLLIKLKRLLEFPFIAKVRRKGYGKIK